MYFDTNVIIYAIEDNARYGKRCKEILAAIQNHRCKVGASSVVLLEIMNVLQKLNIVLRTKGIPEIDISANIDVILALPIVWFDLTPGIMHRAATVRGLRPADAVHVVTAELEGIREIISADQDFDRVAGLTRIDPLEWKN